MSFPTSILFQSDATLYVTTQSSTPDSVTCNTPPKGSNTKDFSLCGLLQAPGYSQTRQVYVQNHGSQTTENCRGVMEHFAQTMRDEVAENPSQSSLFDHPDEASVVSYRERGEQSSSLNSNEMFFDVDSANKFRLRHYSFFNESRLGDEFCGAFERKHNTLDFTSVSESGHGTKHYETSTVKTDVFVGKGGRSICPELLGFIKAASVSSKVNVTRQTSPEVRYAEKPSYTKDIKTVFNEKWQEFPYSKVEMSE